MQYFVIELQINFVERNDEPVPMSIGPRIGVGTHHCYTCTASAGTGMISAKCIVL